MADITAQVTEVDAGGKIVTESTNVFYLDTRGIKYKRVDVAILEYTKGTETSISVKLAKQFKDGQKAYILDEADLSSKTLMKIDLSANQTTPLTLTIDNIDKVDRVYVEVETVGATADGTLDLGIYPQRN